MATTFDRDEYELRWPPQLFIDEANRLRRYTTSQVDEILGVDRIGWTSEMEWLLTEAFASTVPTETMKRVLRGDVQWGGPNLRGAEQWISQLLGEVANFPGPDTRKPYWSARTTARPAPTRLRFTDVTRHFVRLIEEFEANGYLVNAFGQKCVDDQGPRPDPSAVLERRLGYDIFGWPLEFSRPGWEVDDFYDLVEVLHDLVARPSRRWYHDKSGCGWHYGGFATRPARRLYRWQVNRLLAGSDLGLRLAEEGEDLGRLVRMEPTGLEDLPEEALQTARPETVDRVQHAIALFRSRKATVEERRSAVIALVGILQERRDLLKAELLSKDEDALFYVANKFAIRHQGADQRSDYDDVYLDWLFGGISPPSISPTSCLLARRSHSRAVGHRSHLPDRQDFHLDRPLRGPLSVMVMVLTESLRRAAPMPYKQAAEQRQELPSRSIPRRRRPEFVPSRSMPRRRRPEFVPAGRVHAIDTDTREVACGINAAGLYVFDRDWASGIGMDWCPACVEATGYGRPPDA